MTDQEFFGYDEVVEQTNQGLNKNPLQFLADNPKTALVTIFGFLILFSGFLYFRSKPDTAAKSPFAVETTAKEKPLKVNIGKTRIQNVPPGIQAKPISTATTTLHEPQDEQEETETIEEIPVRYTDKPKEKGPAPDEPEYLTVSVKKPIPDKQKNIEAELKDIVQNYSKIFNSGKYSMLTPELMGELMKSIHYRFDKIGKKGNTCIDFSVVKGDDKAYKYAQEIRYFLKGQGYDLPQKIRQIRVTESEIDNVWVWQKNECVVLTVGNPGE